MRPHERITEQDLVDLKEQGYFPYSSSATAAGALLSTVLFIWLASSNIEAVRAVLTGESSMAMVTFGVKVSIGMCLICLISFLVIGTIQTKFHTGSLRKRSQETAGSPGIWFFVAAFLMLTGFYMAVESVPALLMSFGQRSYGEILSGAFSKWVKVFSTLGVLTIFGGIIMSRIYFNMNVRRYLHKVNSSQNS